MEIERFILRTPIHTPIADIMARRYVHGPGVDEPVLWYEGAATNVGHNWLIADRQGSIIATTDGSGAATTYAYDAYGVPREWFGPGGAMLSRFRYTGQAALPELQLYHYKARVYDPGIGRFLQTDPVGYEDDLNLYVYVRNDPLNLSDTSGREASCGSPPCPDIPLPRDEVRERGAAPIAREANDRNETGTNVYENPETGELTVAVGPEAGRPVTHPDGRPGFEHNTRNRPTGTRTILRTHTHGRARPQGQGARSPRTRDAHNGPNQDDVDIMRETGRPVQVVTSDSRFTLYRVDSQDRLHLDQGSVEDLALGSLEIEIDPPE